MVWDSAGFQGVKARMTMWSEKRRAQVERGTWCKAVCGAVAARETVEANEAFLGQERFVARLKKIVAAGGEIVG